MPPPQEERIIERFREIQRLSAVAVSTAETDFELHLAIADAANNPQFRDFLSMLGPSVIPRRALKPEGREPVTSGYLDMLNKEHERTISATIEGEEDAARSAMPAHLQGS